MPEAKEKDAIQRTTEDVKSAPKDTGGPQPSGAEKVAPEVKARKQSNQSGKDEPAAKLETGVRVETAKRTEDVSSAASINTRDSKNATGALIGAKVEPKGDFEAQAHRFSEGEVGVYKSTDVGVEVSRNKAPFGEPVKSVKVGSDGAFKVSGLDSGSYVAAQNIGTDEKPDWKFLSFQVK